MKEMVYGWERKIEILDEDNYMNYHYVIVSYGNHPCAYVEIPEGHPFYDYYRSNLEDEINCHGGVTYTGDLYHVLGTKGKVFVGWDYAHAGDFTGIYLHPEFGQKEDSILMKEKRWTTEEIFEEVKNVIEQLRLKEGK